MSDEQHRRIAFIADDWGLSPRIHEAITHLAELDAIEGAGIMMGQEFTSSAVEWARANESFETGIHLFANDDDCRPLTRAAWPLAWPEKLQLHLFLGLPRVRGLVLREVRAQLEAYRATGLPLGFVNSHFHFHAHSMVIGPLCEWLEELFPDFQGWMRLGEPRLFPNRRVPGLDALIDIPAGILGRFLQTGETRWTGKRNTTLWGVDRTFAMNAGEIVSLAQELGPGSHEFFFHPGRHWDLAEQKKGTDRENLKRLATLLPRSQRGVLQGFP